MPEVGAAADKLIETASKVPFNDFVDFTTGLVRNVTQAVNESNREQLAGYVSLVDAIAGTLEQFQQKAIGDVDAAARDYLNTVILPAYGDTNSTHLKDHGTDSIGFDADPAKHKELVAVFAGLQTSGDDPKEIKSDTTSLAQTDLIELATLELKRSAAHSYGELKALVQMGMQRIVAKTIKIKTTLLFEATSNDTASTSSTSTSVSQESRALNWGLSGSASFSQTKKSPVMSQSFAAAISGGVSSSKSSTNFRVSTVDSRSTSSLETKIQITGSVELEFFTDYFPAMPQTPAVPALPAAG